MFVSDSNADAAACLGWLGCSTRQSSVWLWLWLWLWVRITLGHGVRGVSGLSIFALCRLCSPLSTRHFPPGYSIQFAYNLRSFYFISPTAIYHLYAWVLAFTRGVASAYPQFIDSSISVSSRQKLFKPAQVVLGLTPPITSRTPAS